MIAAPTGARVDVWQARLDGPRAGWLSPEEREGCRALAFADDRRRFAAAHIFLREVLSRYLGCAPAEITFAGSPGGKPRLEPPRDNLCFNLSHGGELALVAVATARQVGVDVEPVRQHGEPEVVAPRVLGPQELTDLKAAPASARQELFLRFWTRKEALVKACGVGLGADLAAIDAGARSERLVTVPGQPTPLTVASLDLAPGYVGAVAATGNGLVYSQKAM